MRYHGCGSNALSRRWGALAFVGAIGFTAPANADAADDADDAPVRCERLSFDVAQAPGGSTDNRMAAFLCARGSIQHKTIQVLIHGATYDHNYWNFPFHPETYSYVDFMTRAGYAVLSMDRIGYGESTHPADGASVTLHTGAFTIHQVVQALRSERVIVPGFGRIKGERIELVGFSLGSFIAVLESSNYRDVDAVVLSSYSYRVGAGGIASFGLVIPAPQDPKFVGFPPTYLSEAPGARQFLFFHLPDVEQPVLDLDQALRQTWTVGELNDIIPSLIEPPAMHVPVLVVDGDFDTIACNTPCSANNWLVNETASYPADTCAELAIIPEAGHSLALHKNAPAFFSAVQEWSDRRVGASTKMPARQPCRP